MRTRRRHPWSSTRRFTTRFWRARLLPCEPPTDVARAWPTGTVETTFARGCLLAGAAGDALGRPAEGRPPRRTFERYGRLRDFVPWRGWRSGPIGTFTDDTQLTLWTAESLLADDGPHHEVFAGLLAERRAHIRGRGRATDDAIARFQEGAPWYEAGTRSAGNGAAMRAAPFGIAFGHDPAALRRAAALNAVVTHADPMAVASTIVQASAVAYLLRTTPGTLEPAAFLDWLVATCDDLHDPGHPERRAGTDRTPVRLVDRIAELAGMLDLESENRPSATPTTAPSSSSRSPLRSGASCTTQRTSKRRSAPQSTAATTPTPLLRCAATSPAPTSAPMPSRSAGSTNSKTPTASACSPTSSWRCGVDHRPGALTAHFRHLGAGSPGGRHGDALRHGHGGCGQRRVDR